MPHFRGNNTPDTETAMETVIGGLNYNGSVIKRIEGNSHPKPSQKLLHDEKDTNVDKRKR